MLTAEELRPIYERNNRNAQRTADEIGVPVSTLKGWVSYREIRSPFIVTGRSTLKNIQTGEDMLVWEKESLDKQAAEEARHAAFEAMAAQLPRQAPIAAPQACNDDLCNVYTFTDYHLGMLAWRKEGGADWDLDIAEQTLLDSFAEMVRQSPKAHTAVINLQGDFLHTDGLVPATPAHGHILDADSRYPKIVAAAIRIVRTLIWMALIDHNHVHVIVAEGNHDESGSVWMRQMFDALYSEEPRVTVDTSALPFYTFLWGETFLGFHHGHKVKNEQLPLLFAAQFRSAWGATSKAYIHCGHRHHCDEKEYNGATVVQHPTLAARDAYAARGGWIAERAAQSITYSKRFGQVGRIYVSPEMVAA
jgi:hypothetical protein